MRSVLFCLGLVFPVTGFTFALPFEGYPAFNAAGAITAHAFPTEKMETRKLEIKVSPLHFQYQREDGLPVSSGSDLTPKDTRIEGLGLVAAANYGVFENETGRFGFGFLMGAFKGEGSALGLTFGSGNRTFAKAAMEGEGKVVALTANMDLFSWFESLSLPMFVGLSYLSVKQSKGVTATVPTSAGEAANLTGEILHQRQLRQNSLALALGISARIELGEYFSFIPFASTNLPLSDIKQSETSQNLSLGTTDISSVQDFSRKHLVSTVGLEWLIPAWSVSTKVILPVGIQGQGTSLFLLTWAKPLVF